MFKGIAKKGLSSLLSGFLAVILGVVAVLLGVDPSASIIESIAKYIANPPPALIRNPFIQATLFAIGIGLFLIVEAWDRNEYRKWLIKNVQPTMGIDKAIQYIQTDSVHHGCISPIALIRQHAQSGNLAIWGVRLEEILWLDAPNGEEALYPKRLIPENFWMHHEFTETPYNADGVIQPQTYRTFTNVTEDQHTFLSVNEDQLHVIFPPRWFAKHPALRKTYKWFSSKSVKSKPSTLETVARKYTPLSEVAGLAYRKHQSRADYVIQHVDFIEGRPLSRNFE